MSLWWRFGGQETIERAIFQYAQAQELRQLQNQIGFLIRLVIANKFSSTSGRFLRFQFLSFMRFALRISVQIL